MNAFNEMEVKKMAKMDKRALKIATVTFFVALTVNLSFAEWYNNTTAERTVKPPPVESPATTAREEIVTGMCTFGDCPVATTEEVVKEFLTTELVSETYTLSDEHVAKNATTDESSSVVKESLLTASNLEAVEAVTLSESVTEWDGLDGLLPDYSAVYMANEFCVLGEVYWGGWRWTWYSEKVLPGGGLDIPGRHTSGGYVRDINGYICLASDALDYGTAIETPFGSYGKVYDCGCDYDTIDVYVSW